MLATSLLFHKPKRLASQAFIVKPQTCCEEGDYQSRGSGAGTFNLPVR
jgi:hypothetical protein